MLVEVDVLEIFSFLPVVTEIANEAASLSLPSILPEEVTDVGESLSPISD